MAAFAEPPFGEPEMQRWLERRLDHWSRFGYGLFALVLKETGELVGDCGLENMDIDGTTAVELGYDLAARFWNRGLATEAARAVLAFALQEPGLGEVVSLIRKGNRASTRVAEKVGMSWQRDLNRDGIEYWLFGLRPPIR
jgi:ribosomal-protein-alanine N-acetyltransferase